MINVKEDGSYEVKFAIRKDAESVLDDLLSIINNYGEVTLADLRGIIGEIAQFGEHKIKWIYLLRDFSINRVKNGYILNLPKPIQGE